MKKSFTLIELLVICHNIIVIAHNNGYVKRSRSAARPKSTVGAA